MRELEKRVSVPPVFPVADLVPVTAPLMLFPTADLVEVAVEFVPIVDRVKADDPDRLPLLVVFIPYLTALEPPRRPV